MNLYTELTPMREVFQSRSAAIKTPLSQGRTMGSGINIRQLLIGLAILVLGTVFYYFCRSVEPLHTEGVFYSYFVCILVWGMGGK